MNNIISHSLADTHIYRHRKTVCIVSNYHQNVIKWHCFALEVLECQQNCIFRFNSLGDYISKYKSDLRGKHDLHDSYFTNIDPMALSDLSWLIRNLTSHRISSDSAK